MPISFSQPVMNSAICGETSTLGAHGVAEVQRLPAAGHLADTVAVRVLVARVVEDLVGLVQIEVELLVGRDLGQPLGIGGDAHGLGRLADPAQDAVDDRLLVDRVHDRLADPLVLERRVRLLEAVAAVDGELVEAALGAFDGREVTVLLQREELLLRRALDEVDLAGAQRGDHGVRVVVLADDHLVERGLALPVVLVGLEARELALLVLVERERARADVGLPVELRRPFLSNSP